MGSLALSIPSFFRGLSESGDTLEDEIDESDGGKKALLSTVGRAYHWVAVTWSMLPVEMATAGLLGRFFGAPNRGGALVRASEEVFEQAVRSGPETINGFRFFGNKGLVGKSFQRNVFLIEAQKKGGSSLRGLVNALEAEARAAGASATADGCHPTPLTIFVSLLMPWTVQHQTPATHLRKIYKAC